MPKKTKLSFQAKKRINPKNDAVKILKKDLAKDPELRQYYEEEKLKNQIARQIREYRHRLELTQTDLAKLLKTSQAAVARFEDADYEGNSIEKLQQVATALHCRLVIRFEPAA